MLPLFLLCRYIHIHNYRSAKVLDVDAIFFSHSMFLMRNSFYDFVVTSAHRDWIASYWRILNSFWMNEHKKYHAIRTYILFSCFFSIQSSRALTEIFIIRAFRPVCRTHFRTNSPPNNIISDAEMFLYLIDCFASCRYNLIYNNKWNLARQTQFGWIVFRLFFMFTSLYENLPLYIRTCPYQVSLLKE